MKNHIKISFLSALIMMFSACNEEFLEFVPEDQATVGSWYRNASEIEAATAALYGRSWFGYNDVFSWCAGDLLSGDMYHNWDAEGQFFYLSFNNENTHISSGWQGLYDVISFANAIINDMPPIAAGYGVDEEIINAGLGEARFIRGFAYYLLAENWGDIPIIENPAENISNNTLHLPKNTVSSVYEFVRRDLEFAANNLPEINTPGKVTSWSAKGALAKLHLTIAQRKVGDAAFSSSTADDFAAAAEYAADVINNSGLSLFSNYEDLFKIANEDAGEILFGIQWTNNGWGVGNSRQARFARHSAVTGDGAAWGGGKCATLNLIATLEANAGSDTDSRRRAIYMQAGDHYDYIATVNGGYDYEIVSQDDEGNQLEGQTQTLTSIKKYVVGSVDDHGYSITNQDSPMDNYMLRLADVYLIYAEALMGTNSSLSSGAGLDAYNAVRARAGLAARSSVTYEQLQTERRIELAFEGLNWLDIKRRYYRNSSEALAYLNSQDRTSGMYRIDTSDGLEDDPAGYEMVPAQTTSTNGNSNDEPIVVFTAGHMVLPIPASEVNANPMLGPEESAVDYFFSE